MCLFKQNLWARTSGRSNIKVMDRDFFKFSIGAVGIIAIGLIAFYFLAELRQQHDEAARQNMIEAGVVVAPLIGE